MKKWDLSGLKEEVLAIVEASCYIRKLNAKVNGIALDCDDCEKDYIDAWTREEMINFILERKGIS